MLPLPPAPTLTAAASLLLILSATAGPVSAQSPKVLRFSPTKSLGKLYELKQPPTSWLAPTTNLKKNHFLSAARGTVNVPAGTHVWLDCEEVVIEKPTLLDTLSADNLAFLRLQNMGGKDHILPHIARLTGLIRLDLRDCEFTDQGLTQLQALKQLESLSVRGCGIQGHFFKNLQGLSKLRFLDAGNNFMPASSSKLIAQIKSLQDLNVARTDLTDEGLGYLSTLGDLRKLNIEKNSKISGRGLKALQRCKHLSTLKLDGNNLTVDDILALKGLPLKSLDLPYTDLQIRQRDLLCRAFPGCNLNLIKGPKKVDADWEVILAPISK